MSPFRKANSRDRTAILKHFTGSNSHRTHHLAPAHCSDRLFQPLAAPVAPIYLAILLELFTQTKAHQEPLSREFATNIIYGQITAPDQFTLTADAAEEEEI